MDDIFKIIVGVIIGILLIGGIIMIFTPHTAVPTNETNATNESIVEIVQDKVNDFAQDGQVSFTNKNNTYTLTSSNSNNTTYESNNYNNGQVNSNSSIVGGSVQENYQAGHGQYYEINYKDGNFRMYDTETGELIGSSFEADQEKLGVIDGQLL